MKISVDEDGTLVIGEVFSGAYLETSEGNRIGFCMRDDTIEFGILPKEQDERGAQWYRVNMQTSEVEKMESNLNPTSEDQFRAKAISLTNAIIDDLNKDHSIQFDGKLTHTGRDMVAQKIVEPWLRALDEQDKTDGGGS